MIGAVSILQLRPDVQSAVLLVVDNLHFQYEMSNEIEPL